MSALHTPHPAALRTVNAVECCQQARTRETVQCGVCQKSFSGAAVINGPIEIDFHKRTYFQLRTLFCNHCDHLQQWRQITTQEGVLTPDLLDATPGYNKSPHAIERFLRLHPEAAGVI
jgi:hypothetical protein